MQFAVKQRASPSMLQQLLDAGAAACDSSDIASVLRHTAQFASAEAVSTLLSMLTAAQQGSSSSSSTSTASGRSGWPAGAMRDALKAAVIAGRVEVAELLLQTGHPELLQAGCKETALHSAIQRSDPALVSLLLKHGADVNGREPAAAAASGGALAPGPTPLHAAILQHSTQIMQQLLDAGADPQMQSGGKTALQHAMQCAFSLSYPACMSLSDLESYDSTDMFECLLAHSSLQQSAAELVSTAWSLAGAEHWHGHAMQPRPDDHNMPNWLDYTDEEVSRARPMHRNINMCTRAEARFKTKAQHNMLCSLLQAAAAKDGAATETAIFQCINKVYSVYRVAFGRYNCDLRCGCGWCTPDLPEPQDILRAQTLLEALSAVWLTSEPADIAAQRAAVQHMLVSAAASLRQAQQLQEQQRAEASSIADRLAEVALREQRVAEREQQVKAREEALGQVPLRAAAPVKKRRQ